MTTMGNYYRLLFLVGICFYMFPFFLGAIPPVRELYDPYFIPGLRNPDMRITSIRDNEALDPLYSELTFLYRDYLESLLSVQDELLTLPRDEFPITPVSLFEEINITYGMFSSRVIRNLKTAGLVESDQSGNQLVSPDLYNLLFSGMPQWFFIELLHRENSDTIATEEYHRGYEEFLNLWWETGVNLWDSWVFHDVDTKSLMNPELWNQLSRLHTISEQYDLPDIGIEFWSSSLPLRTFIFRNSFFIEQLESRLPGFFEYIQRIDQEFARAHLNSAFNGKLLDFEVKFWTDLSGFSLLPEAWLVYWNESEAIYNTFAGHAPHRVTQQQNRDHWNKVSLLQHRLGLQWVYQGRKFPGMELDSLDGKADDMAQWFESFILRTHEILQVDATPPDLFSFQTWFALGILIHPYPDVIDVEFIQTLYNQVYQQGDAPSLQEVSNILSQWGMVLPKGLTSGIEYQEGNSLTSNQYLFSSEQQISNFLDTLLRQFLPHLVNRPDPIDIVSHADRFLASVGYWFSQQNNSATRWGYTRDTFYKYMTLQVFEYQRLGYFSPMNTLHLISELYGTEKSVVQVVKALHDSLAQGVEQ